MQTSELYIANGLASAPDRRAAVEHRGATRAGFSASTTIARHAFGATMAGGGLVGSRELAYASKTPRGRPSTFFRGRRGACRRKRESIGCLRNC